MRTLLVGLLAITLLGVSACGKPAEPAVSVTTEPGTSHPLPPPVQPSASTALSTSPSTSPASTATPAPTSSSSSKATPTDQGRTLFSADFATAGFSHYEWVYPEGVKEGTDYAVVNDPTGTKRTVALLDSSRGLTHGTNAARVDAEGPRIIKPKAHGNTVDEYWVGLSFLLPRDAVLTEPSQWQAFATAAFGPPFSGSSPLVMSLSWTRGGNQRLQLHGDPAYLGEFSIQPDRWYQVIYHFTFAYNGWVEMWINPGPTSNSWKRLMIKGQPRLAMATMAHGVNDAWYTDSTAMANSPRIGSYGIRGKMYFGHHKVGIGSPLSVAMDDYGPWNGQLP